MLSFPLHLASFCLFAVSLWLAGTLFDEVVRCRLLGELLIGLIFGNIAVGTLLPADKSILVLVGELGVLGLIFEAGLGTNLGRVLRAGPRAALVATVGIVMPLATGFGFMYGLLQLDHIQALDRTTNSNSQPPQRVTEAIASGAALASTSIAIAVTMMKQQQVLDTPVGTLITTAAMLDDVVSLILLGIVSSIGQSESASGSGIQAMTVIQPVLASLGIICVGLVGCIVVARIKTKKASNAGLELDMGDSWHTRDDHGMEGADAEIQRVNSGRGESPQGSRNRPGRIWSRVIHLYNRFEATIKLAVMVISGLGYSILAEYLGSSRLLGAFVVGVFFSPFTSLQHEYEQQVTHKIQPALSALFFASIGMAIPLTSLLKPVLFGWGLVYAVIASLSKLTTMLAVSSKASSASATGSDGLEFNYNARWMVGTAMIARGELGLLMSQQAQQQGVMGQTALVVTTWSVVLCTLFGIGALGLVMKKRK
ncbi:Hsp70 ATPase ssc1 [Mortierella alpina]|uniref:Hsp70 ATPase ssc1 n=1 Tax=Mortierella alpina TaxID=64518 RepID=A0A9P6LXB6_MORAP|nr:Hsp70 ATPase ssc1 [Mortierella alpina]